LGKIKTIPTKHRISKKKKKLPEASTVQINRRPFKKINSGTTQNQIIIQYNTIQYNTNTIQYTKMAIGPFARILAQIIVPVIAVLARAIPAAYGQALNNAKKAGVDASEAAVPVFGKRISKSEALSILNITEKDIASDPKIIKKVRQRNVESNRIVNGLS
jgi:hypothetical protein